MGGVGRLVYREDRRRYQLAAGMLTPYVTDGDSVRAMRPDEGGGTMAMPCALAATDGAVFAMVASYETLLRLDGAGGIEKQALFGTFRYGGSMGRALLAHRDHLFFLLDDGTLVGYGRDLTPAGRVKLSSAGWYQGRLAVAGDRLYLVSARDPRPSRGCEGADCGRPYLAVGVVDVGDPAQPRVERDEQIQIDRVPGYLPLQAVDGSGWLVVAEAPGGQQQRLQWRRWESLATVASEAPLEGRVIAMLESAPFAAVAREGDRLVLLSITIDPARGIVHGPSLPLDLPPDRQLVMRRDGEHLFLAVGERLRVVRTGGGVPEVVLSQDFVGTSGSAQLSVEDLVAVRGLAPVATRADRARTLALLSLDYWDDAKRTQLESQLASLTPEDGWAVEPLTAALGRRAGSAWSIQPAVMKALGSMGETAAPAIPAMLDATMEGAAVRGDTFDAAAAAIPLIDPDGSRLVAVLPAFVKGHYEAGAKHVAQEILGRIDGDPARAALPHYR